jgi:hypothetical protein
MAETPETVTIDGGVLLVDSADVVRDQDGNAIAVRGHGGFPSVEDEAEAAVAREAEVQRQRDRLEEIERKTEELNTRF